MNNENNSKHSDYSKWKVVQTGIAGGAFLFLFSWLAAVFHFLDFSPVSFLNASKIVQYFIFILVTVLISIVLALLYYVLLRKRKPFLTGIFAGLLLFLVIIPFISNSMLNLITVFCLLLCYSIFISMSVSWIHEWNK